LPKWIETESGDEIGPPFDPVPPDAESIDEANSHVQPHRNRESVRGMNGAAPREQTIEPDFMLDSLLHRLATSDNRQRHDESDGNQDPRFFQAHRISQSPKPPAAPPTAPGR
jgi:hypothetical protein